MRVVKIVPIIPYQRGAQYEWFTLSQRFGSSYLMPWKRILGQNTKRCRLVQRSPCRETTKESYCEVSFAVERSWQRLSCENTKNYVMSRSGEPQTIYSPRCSSVNLLTNTELYSLENTSPENTSSPKFFTNHHLQNTQCPSRTIQKILPLIRIQEANASFYFNPPNNSCNSRRIPPPNNK